MSSVVSLSGLAPSALGEPREALAKALEALLEKAKSGHLQSLVATGFAADGCRVSLWVDTHENVFEMLGALNWLQHEYVNRHTTEED